MYHEDTAEDGAALGNHVPHIDIGLAARDDEVVVERGNGQEGSTDAENLHEVGRRQPLVAYEHHDELGCHERQPEHEGEGDEAGEAQHLGEGTAEAFEVIAYLDEGGLCHSLHHARNGVGSHGVPFVGLGIDAHHVFVVDLTQHKGEDVVVDLVEDVSDEHLGGEAEHLADGSEEG